MSELLCIPPVKYGERPPESKGGHWEKMSKSRGNGVTVDEVVAGVAAVAPGYEFCDPSGATIDHRAWEVWRDRSGNGSYFTATRYGKRPVFLKRAGSPVAHIDDLPQFDDGDGNGPYEQHGVTCWLVPVTP